MDILLSQVSIPSRLLIINAPAFSKVESNASPTSSSKTPARTNTTVLGISKSTLLPSLSDTLIKPLSTSFVDIHAFLVLII